MFANTPAASATTCPSGHPLVRNDEIRFTCDDCHADYTQNPNHSSHRCTPCDYDRCIGCSSVRLGRLCPSRHPLTARVTPVPNYRCDACNAIIAAGDSVASCPACDYDVCKTCVLGPQTTAAGGIVPRAPLPPPQQQQQQSFHRPITNNTKEPHKCPQGHALTGREDAEFQCDVCNTPARLGERALKCQLCDFDICVGCVAAENGNVCPNHPDRGPLTKGACGQTTNVKTNMKCNVCGDALLIASSVLFCTQPNCSYQVCKTCIFASDRLAPTIPDNFPAMWAAVEAFNRKQLPKSAMAVIKEKIIPKASGANPPNHAELMKATIYLAKATIETEDVGMDVGMAMLERELSERTFITSPTDIAFTHSILGEMYERYLQIVRYQISSRTDPGEDVPLNADIKLWAPAQLERVAFSHHLKSLEQSEVLGTEHLSQYDTLLTKAFDKGSVAGRQRPSLLDFIAHRALTFFGNSANFLTEPSNRFVLTDVKAYGDAKTFVGLAFDTTDSTSRTLQALLVLQKLLRNKLAVLAAAPAGSAARSDAIFSLIEVEIARADFVRVAVAGLTAGEKAAHYEQLLLNLVAPAADCPAAAARVYARLGAFYMKKRVVRALPADGAAPADDEDNKNAFETTIALQYFNKVAQVCPNPNDSPIAWGEAHSGINEIKSTTLSARTENIIYPNTPFLLNITAKAIDSLNYRICPISEDQYAKFNNEYHRRREMLQSLKPLSAETNCVTVDLSRAEDDYSQRTFETVVNPISNKALGRFMLLVWCASNKGGQGVPVESADHFCYVSFHVSRIGVMHTASEAEREQLVVVDRHDGTPLPGVTATFYSQRWEHGGYKRTKHGKAESDADGIINALKVVKPGRHETYMVEYAIGDDKIAIEDSYSTNQAESHFYTNRKTLFFTDRNIYRPTQTIYFKGLHFEKNEGYAHGRRSAEAFAADAKKSASPPTLCPPGARITVALYDTNHQKKASVEVVTNEFGTFEGTFTAPADGLAGRMYIQCESTGAQHTIRVEEYKRPRFEVTLKAPPQNIRVGDEALVEGKAMNFSGIPLGGATVKYRVRRVARVPWFWLFWGRAPRWPTSSAEIVSDSVVVDADGTFKIKFKAVPDAQVPKDDKPEFEYEVTADVTDITGETQSGRASVTVGYIALKLSTPLSTTMSLASLRALPITLTDLNDSAIAGSATIKVEPLVCPHPIGCPFIKRQWAVPSRILMDKARFKAALPHLAYTDEADADKWALDVRSSAALRTAQSDGSQQQRTVHVDLDQSALSVDKPYRVTITATDRYGTAITVRKVVSVFDDAAPSSVAAASDGNSPYLTFAQNSYRVGETAVVSFGKRLRFDGKPQPILVGLATISKDAVYAWDRTENTQNVVVLSRAITIGATDRGAVAATSAFVAYGRFFSARASSSVPWVEKQLQFEYMSFRNKLEPGQPEQWRIKIKSADPKADPAAIIPAEVLGALYDASLDSLKGNGANTYGNLMGQFPMPSPTIGLSSARYYSTSTSNHMASPSTPYRNFDTYGATAPALNWFSFPFRSERPAPQVFGGFGCCATSCAPQMELRSCAAPMKKMSFGGCAAPPPPPPGAAGAPPPCAAAPEKRKKMASKKESCHEEEHADGNEDEDTGGDEDGDAAGGDFTPAVRTNLKETVFFMPNLRTEVDGTVVIDFTMGEALTKWRFIAFAHTKDLSSASTTNDSIITQKEVMVTPNPPRFLREGDTMLFAAKVSNMGDSHKDGTATLEIMDGITGASLNAAYGLGPSNTQVPFSCGPNGQSAAVSWPIAIPYGGTNLITWRIVAKSGRTGDGEEAPLPVVTNRMLVTDTMPMSVRGGQQKTFTLKSLANTTSTTLSHESYTVEFTSNPAWYAVQALPYIMEFPHECSEQLFSRLYSNSLAQHITQQPQIQRVFEAWKTLDCGAMKSNLAKNEELKSALLQETPWVLEAQSEGAQKQQIALLFDLNRLASERSRGVEKLAKRQGSDGGFPWFPDSRPSLYITQHIAMGFAHLAQLGVRTCSVSDTIQVKAQNYCHWEIGEQYNRLLESVRKGWAKLEDQHVGHDQLLFLYTESFYHGNPSVGGAARSSRSKRRAEVIDYYMGQAAKYATNFNLYGQALIALIFHRNKLYTEVRDTLVKSFRERAIHHDEMGTHWKMDAGYFYYQAPIETQALMIEVFSEVANDAGFVDELRLWLLKNKQTKHWKTTKQTSEAIYALLLGGESWLESSELVKIDVGGRGVMPMLNAEPGTGYVKHRYEGKTSNTAAASLNDADGDNAREEGGVIPAMATITVTNPNKVVAWGAAYWQYFEALDKIQWFQETPLKIKKEVHRVDVTERGEVLRAIANGHPIAVGDKIKIRIEVVVDREMDYVHLKDMRASGLEPTNVMSQRKHQDGLSYYESTKDLATHFFIDHLGKGTYVFEYPLVASQKGEFSNGITTMQCMYAPEFSSHSEGVRLSIQ